MAEIRKVYAVLIGDLERNRCRWDEDIQMDLTEITCVCVCVCVCM